MPAEPRKQKTDTELIQSMDLAWLYAKGWTLRGNLAYRRCIELKIQNKGIDLKLEEIEQILMRYELNADERTMVVNAIKELVEVVNILKEIPQRRTT